MSTLHPTAIIDSSAKLGKGVAIGAYSIIGADVDIGDNTIIGPHVVINGPARIGGENHIFQFASLGEAPQDLKYNGEPTCLEIGDRNTIREYVTINRGTSGGGGVTRIGSDNLLMAYVHIAHDCQLGNNVIFSNNTSLAGHVHIGDFVTLSGFTLVHQFCVIGAYVFTGMGSAISKDVPPFLVVNGNPATPHGLNKVGLRRRDFSGEQIRRLTDVYKILYLRGHSLEEAKRRIQTLAVGHEEIESFTRFIDDSRRSIIR